MFRRFVIWFIALVFFVKAQAIPSDATDSRRELVLSQSPTKALCPSLRCNHSSTTDNVELSRSKRGIGSLILMVTSLGVDAGSLAANLAGAITKGCAFFPSICTNLKLIASYKKYAEREKSEMEELFVQNSKEYVQLREALTNNGIIIYRTNSTINSLQSIGNIEDEIQAVLQSKLPFLSQAASHREANNSIDFILQELDSAEYDLAQIQEMLRKHQTDTLVGIVLFRLINVVVDRSISSLDRALGQVKSRHTPVGNEPKIGLKAKIRNKLIILPKAMKQLGINLEKSLRETFRKISKGTRSGAFRRRFLTHIRNTGIRGAAQFTKRKLVATILSKYKRISSKVKNLPRFRLGKLAIFNKVTGIAFNIVEIAFSTIQWKEKADIVEKSMLQHRKYLYDLRNERIQFEDQKKKVSKEWQNALEDFKEISKSFKSLISFLMEYNDFLDVDGVMKPPVKRAEPILSVDFQRVTKESIIGMQTRITGFLYEINNNLTKIENELTARKISYTKIRKDSEKGKKIQDITDDLKEFYTYVPYDEGRQFGANLKMEDVVCALAIIRKDKVEYDGFQLQPYRPRCEVNDTAFANIEKGAYQQRIIIIMDDVIQRELSDANIVLVQLKNRISNKLSDEDSKNISSAVTDTDILCRISKLYPNKAEFDFIPLQSFRPSCADVDEKMMTTLKSKAVKMRNIAKSLKHLSKICKEYKFCPCIPTIRQTLQPGTTDEDIKTTIKRLNPGETEYCGTTGCKCVQL